MKAFCRIKFSVAIFLLGFPYGLLGKVYDVADGNGKYTLWDRLRYRILTGEKL